MFKKTLAAAVLVCAVPALANAAWNLSTQARNVGGSITSANGTQTVVNNVKSSSIVALTPQVISAVANSGYSVAKMTLTDTSIDPATRQLVKVVSDVTAQAGSYTLTPVDNHSYMIAAIFSASSVNITASNPGGTVSPSLIKLTYGTTLTRDLRFTFVPAKGYSISAITGAPAAATTTVPGGINQAAYVVIPAGTKMTSAVTMAAVVSNNNVGLNSILPQIYSAGSAASVSATVTGVTTPSYTWSYISGPANVPVANGAQMTFTPGPALTLAGTTSNKLTFTAPATAGQYMFKVVESVSGTTQYATVKVVAAAADNGQVCQNCHTGNGIPSASAFDQGIYTRYQASIHGQSTHASCDACHFGGNPTGHPGNVNADTIDPAVLTANVDNVIGAKGTVINKGTVFCTSCHNPLPHGNALKAGVTCVQCHTSPNGTGGSSDAHSIQGLSCQGCHSVAQTNNFSDRTLVSDNNNNTGVRAVTGEFTKWSHHIVNPAGVAIQDEQCAVCHMEGTVGGYGFGVDGTKHMVDNKIHLRIANSASDAEFAWDPSAPNHSGMDNFCMACHSAAGATSPMNVKLQTAINALNVGLNASAGNPFGDTISNRYDKMMRPRVTNVDDQFNTSNNSHHGVKGPRYTGRTRNAGPRQIASAAAFAANSTATLQGIRSTIYDAGNFNALSVPLADATGEAAPRTGSADLGDDSTLHCGDCHTVGQYAPGSASKADGTRTTAVIGAHGSNNEYLLRNSIGTDERHVGVAYSVNADGSYTVTNSNAPFLVCFNCHNYNNYGEPMPHSGADNGNVAGDEMANPQPHAGEYAMGGRCNGPGNTLSFNGYTTGAGTDGFSSRFTMSPTAADSAAGYQTPDFGAVFGIQCLNCHNSGAANAYGGIHGSANDTDWNGVTAQSLLATNNVTPDKKGYFVDGMGNVNREARFLPGLGNAQYVPGTLGGLTGGAASGITRSTKPYGSTAYVYWTYNTGGVVNDSNWEQKHWQQTASTVINYTNAKVTGTAYAGAGCYTLGTSTDVNANVTAGLQAPSQTGPNGPATSLMDNWGGCEDHSAAQGGGNHGFLKRIVRPITY